MLKLDKDKVIVAAYCTIALGLLVAWASYCAALWYRMVFGGFC